MARFNRSAVPRRASCFSCVVSGTGDCVTCNADLRIRRRRDLYPRRAGPADHALCGPVRGNRQRYPPLDQKSRMRCLGGQRAGAAHGQLTAGAATARTTPAAATPGSFHARGPDTPGRCGGLGELVIRQPDRVRQLRQSQRHRPPVPSVRAGIPDRGGDQRRDRGGSRDRARRVDQHDRSAPLSYPATTAQVARTLSCNRDAASPRPRRACNRSTIVTGPFESPGVPNHPLGDLHHHRRFRRGGCLTEQPRARLHHGAIRGGRDHTDTRSRPPRWVHDDHRFRRVGATAAQ